MSNCSSTSSLLLSDDRTTTSVEPMVFGNDEQINYATRPGRRG